jgi:hypothetical protein
MSGSAVTFVAGAPEDVVPCDANVVALVPSDLKSGVEPASATLADVHPIRQVNAAREVVLWMPDGRVRVLKSADAAMVGTERDAMPSDGKAP